MKPVILALTLLTIATVCSSPASAITPRQINRAARQSLYRGYVNRGYLPYAGYYPYGGYYGRRYGMRAGYGYGAGPIFNAQSFGYFTGGF